MGQIQSIDYAIDVEGKLVGAITLQKSQTLADARREIDGDGLPVPADYRFVLPNGAPVSRSQESKRIVGDSAGDGGRIILKPGPLEELRECLGPLHHLDDAMIAEQVLTFVDGTRRWAFDRFDAWVRAGPGDPHRVFVLAGHAGLGKTGIMCKLAHDRRGVVVARHFCRHDDARRSNPRSMLLSIAFQLAVSFPEYCQKLEGYIFQHKLTRSKLMGSEYDCVSIFTELFETLLNNLEIRTKTERKVILIDAIDECTDGGNRRFGILECIRKYFSHLPPWLGVVITTRPEVPIKEKLKRFDPIEIHPLSSDNLADLKLFFRALFSEDNIRKRLKNVDVDQAVETLVAKSQGLFIYAVMTADAMRCSKDTITESLLVGFPDGLDGFYQEQMERVFPATDHCLAWDIIKLVIAAVEPLHIELIKMLTESTEEECRVAVQEISRLFPVQSQHILVYHKSLEDWLVSEKRSESRYHIRLDSVEEQLARGCLKILRISGICAGDKTGISPSQMNLSVVQYPLRHGVKHMVSCGMQKEARCTILDVGWLNVRTETRDCAGVIQDCRLISDGDRVVELVARAISLAQTTLLRNPGQFAGQLVGRLTAPANPDGGEKIDVRVEIFGLLERLKLYDYGGKSWWCPIMPCWDSANSPCLRVMTGHLSAVRCVRWSHDGEHLASGCLYGTVRIWVAETGECLLALKAEKDVGKVNEISWSHDNERIACAFSGRINIRILDVATGESTELPSDGCCVGHRSVVWSPDDKCIAVANGGSLLILDANDGTRLNEFHNFGDASFVSSVDWSHNGLHLAAAAGKTIRLFRMDVSAYGTLEQSVEFDEHAENVNAISWSHDDSMILSTSHDGLLRIWYIDTADCLLVSSKLGAVRAADWSHNDKHVVASYSSNAVRVWDVEAGKCTHVFRGHTGQILSVGWSPSMRRVVSAGADRTVRVWDVASGHSMMDSEGHNKFISCEAWSSDGKSFLTAGVDGNIRIWDVSTGKTKAIFRGQKARINCITCSRDGKFIASGSSDRQVRVWNMTCSGATQDKELLYVLKGHAYAIRSVAWTTDNLFLASGAHDIRLWCMGTGVCVKVFTNEKCELNVYSLAWSPDSTCLVSAVADHIAIWNVREGRCKILKELIGVRLLAYSDDGENLLSMTTKSRDVSIICASSGMFKQLVDRSEIKEEMSRLNFFSAMEDFYISGLLCDAERVDMNRFGVYDRHACGISGTVVRFFVLLGGRKSTSEENKICFLQSDPLVFRDQSNDQYHAVPRLDFRRERDLMRQCLINASRDIQLLFRAATTEALQDAVITRADCVHFSGHGAPTYLLLEDGRGGAHFVDETLLRSLYPPRSSEGKTSAPHKLAFISACFSEYLAGIFVDAGIQHVVCCEHDAQLTDEASHVFMKSFYMSLAIGHSVEVSFEMGRQAVAAGPFVLNAEEEKKKFKLLPENRNHDDSIIFARPLEEWKSITMLDLALAMPTEVRDEGQVQMYILLSKLLTGVFVTVLGASPSERSSICAATCQYIFDRKGTTEIDVECVLHLDSMYFEKGTISPYLYQQLSSAGLSITENGGSSGQRNPTIQGFLSALQESKVLIFIDAPNAASMKYLRPLTNRFKLLLSSNVPLGEPMEEVFDLNSIL